MFCVVALAGLPTPLKLFGRNEHSRKKSHTLKLFCIDKKMVGGGSGRYQC
jgi:hypothetical protein